MAKLEDIASLLHVDLNLPPKSSVGKKRRPWLEENKEETSIQINDLNQETKLQPKGSINPVDQPQPKRSINPVDQPQPKRSINPVDQPQPKGSINPVSQTGLINPIDGQPIKFEKLRGNPLSVILFLFTLVDEPKLRITRKTSLSEIMKATNICRDSAKTALRFLCKNKIITKLEFKAGAQGWSKYSIAEQAYLAMLKIAQTGSINPVSQMGFNSSSNIYNKTTTIEINPISISATKSLWDEIDVSPLADIGFNKNHLIQLKTKSTPEVVQESIKHFAFGLHNNAKTKDYKDPISVLMGVLRKGEVWIEAAYKAPQEISMEKVLLQRNSEQERQQKLEQELMDSYFNEWVEAMQEEQIKACIGDTPMGGSKIMQDRAKRGLLREYFQRDKWPLMKKEILG